ncbi:MAG: helix-turn-helix domain-containing protein [Bacilli bacterium]|nr:helix-turn-helix domain-containing protein [Bacilli bacterium]
MGIGEKLLDLRKSKHLSQEEVADKLNVSRQTVSKWETDQSMPDFDKIAPLCELYEISADELLMIKKKDVKVAESEVSSDNLYDEANRRKKAMGISLSIFIYFLSIVWIMIAIPVYQFDPVLSSAIFLMICGIATFVMVYTCIVYKRKKEKKEDKRSKLEKQIDSILSMVILVIYLFLSFTTMAWHITWILWVVYGLIVEIIKLLFMLGGIDNEE